MVHMDDEGVKVGGRYLPFAYDGGCPTCRFSKHLDEVEGLAVDRDVCTMTPDDEDRFLFDSVPDDKLPPCMRE